MPCVKGISFLDVNKAMEKKFGAGCLEKVKPLLDPDTRQTLYEKPVLPITWLEVGMVMRDALAKDKAFGKGDLTFLDNTLEEVAAGQFHGIYKMLFRLLKPETVLAKAGQIWSQYYDSGRLTAVVRGQGQAELILEQFPNPPLHHEVLFLPFIRAALKLTGAKNVVCRHAQCIAQGHDTCRTAVEWTA